MDEKTIRIVVGSECVHKLSAVADAWLTVPDLPEDYEISSMCVKSGVNAEPFGFEEILRGATHRANAVTEKFGRNIVAVGIENGILGPDPLESNIVKGVNLDIAVIVVLAYGKRIVTNSSSIQLPFSEVMVARVIGFDTTTVGQIIADKFGSDPADPHSHLTRGRISRKDLLVRALVVAFQQIYPEDLATAPV